MQKDTIEKKCCVSYFLKLKKKFFLENVTRT